MHQDPVPRLKVAYSKQNVLEMMDAAEHAYRMEDPETPFCFDSGVRYMKEKMQEMMAAADTEDPAEIVVELHKGTCGCLMM